MNFSQKFYIHFHVFTYKKQKNVKLNSFGHWRFKMIKFVIACNVNDINRNDYNEYKAWCEEKIIQISKYLWLTLFIYICNILYSLYDNIHDDDDDDYDNLMKKWGILKFIIRWKYLTLNNKMLSI